MENLKKAMIIRNGNVVGAVGDKNFSTAPIGTVLTYAGNEAPRGYLLADGASYPTTEYPDLYAVIGNTYGGDTENFNVPDYRETVLVGVGENTTDTIADHDVYGLGEFKDDQLQNHTHTLSIPNSYYQYTPTANGGPGSQSKYTDTTSNHSGRKGTTTHGKQKGVTYIIKAFHTNEFADSGVSDDVVEYVDNKFSSVDIKTTVTIPTGQYLKIELGENKLSTVLLSMKTTIGTGYTTFLISNYGIGTDARCRVQQLQGERKFAKYIDGCNLYITPSVADQVWYASAISVQGVNPVLSASETYSGTEITTNSVPKEIIDGLISDTTSSKTSTYSSAKIDEKYGAYTFGTASSNMYLKFKLGSSSSFQPVTVCDQYGGKIEILGMAHDGTYKSVKKVRYSYGCWSKDSATETDYSSPGDANYKIKTLYYHPDEDYYYLDIRQWCTIKVYGAIIKPELVTSLPSGVTLIPESDWGRISDSETSENSTWSSSKIASEINPTIDISKVFSNGALNIATLCSTYGNGRYVIVGQGTAGNGSATIDIWTLASHAISYIVNVTYSNKTSNTFIGLTYENPTINFETGYLSACNHIAKVCTLA